jgi:transposase InsO family protein
VSRFLRWIGIAASKFHDWKRRFGHVNEHNAWVPRDHWLTDDEKERIRSFARQHPLDGYRSLTFMMLDAHVVACSPASVYRVLKAAGLLAGPSPTPTKKGTGFVQPLAPHQHWHTDVSYLNIAGTFYFLCSILDGFSRFIVHWEIREHMQEIDVETILQRGRECHPGVTPRMITDNGPQFISRDFKDFIRIAGMTHVKTSPYYPQSNGKIERWHKTIKGECIRVRVPLSLDDARRIVADYVEHYNQVRLHSAIGYVTPQDKLEGRDQAIFDARDSQLIEARLRRQQLRQAQHDHHHCQPTVTTHPSIDFSALKTTIALAAVLQLLGFQPRSNRSAQQRGPCPLHSGPKHGTSQCFSAHLDKNAFHCFKCGRSGNALDLWVKASHLGPYDAALDLCNRLAIPVPTLTSPPTPNREEEPVVCPSQTCTIT